LPINFLGLQGYREVDSGFTIPATAVRIATKDCLENRRASPEKTSSRRDSEQKRKEYRTVVTLECGATRHLEASHPASMK
jgi:hypothetical protein